MPYLLQNKVIVSLNIAEISLVSAQCHDGKKGHGGKDTYTLTMEHNKHKHLHYSYSMLDIFQCFNHFYLEIDNVGHKICVVLSTSNIITVPNLLRLQMEKMASRYGGWL